MNEDLPMYRVVSLTYNDNQAIVERCGGRVESYPAENVMVTCYDGVTIIDVVKIGIITQKYFFRE